MKVAICSPCRPLIDPDHSEAVSLTMVKLREAGYDPLIFRTRGLSLLEQARSIIATSALDWGADVLFWVDDDIVFQPDDAVRLIRTLGTVVDGAAIESIGAVCSTKRPGSPMNAGLDTDHVTFFRGGRLERVEGHIGLGMVAHSRSIYEHLIAKGMRRVRVNDDGVEVWPFFRSRIEDVTNGCTHRVWYGEDVTFSRRLIEIGVTTWADTRIRTIHRGEYDYRIEDCCFVVQSQDTLNMQLRKASTSEATTRGKEGDDEHCNCPIERHLVLDEASPADGSASRSTHHTGQGARPEERTVDG